MDIGFDKKLVQENLLLKDMDLNVKVPDDLLNLFLCYTKSLGSVTSFNRVLNRSSIASPSLLQS
jgi:hypothetical protein